MLWHIHVDGLVQDYSISNALAMEILQSCTKQLMWVIMHIHLCPSINMNAQRHKYESRHNFMFKIGSNNLVFCLLKLFVKLLFIKFSTPVVPLSVLFTTEYNGKWCNKLWQKNLTSLWQGGCYIVWSSHHFHQSNYVCQVVGVWGSQ